ncbi:hypothetical protein ABT354_23450 [Streptomyces sp. NPDC000594]|uniref:hypothetical protein n=1 Tax=Streptomyces sp. NPDC000594 TaxID=3154261 RepID=UPI003330CC21
MSDHQTDSPFPDARPADPVPSVRAEVQREYAAKLAAAELRAQAAQDGIKLPDGFADYLDHSKLLGEDGSPSPEAIELVLKPLQALKKPLFAQDLGLGRCGPIPDRPPVSLDTRKR